MADDDLYLARVQQGKLAGRVREELEDELRRREEAIINSACALLADGKYLDPQFAVQKWAELSATRRLRNSLLRKEKSGEAAARRMTS